MRTITHLILPIVTTSLIALSACSLDSEILPIEESQTKFIAPTPGARVVPGSYIVVMRDGAKAAPVETAQDIMRVAGLEEKHIGRTFSAAIPGFVARVSEAEARKLARDPMVAFVEQDQYMSLSETWGLDRIDQRDLPLDDASFAGAVDFAGDGEGVHVYILDTGVRATHSEFVGRVGNGYDAVDDDSDPDDCNGHGTHVAGTVAGSIFGIAKAATVHSVRVARCNGQVTNADVIAGVDWVNANHIAPAVANLSLGGPVAHALDNAVEASFQAGVFYSMSAGNDTANACSYSPARAQGGLTVGATDSQDVRTHYSNYGSCVDIYAPGNAIASAWATDDNAFVFLSGTSMAAPHVAGAAALFWANHRGASAQDVADALTSWASVDRVLGLDQAWPNRLLYTGAEDDIGQGSSAPGNGIDVLVTLSLDEYPMETTWVIENSQGLTVAASPPYTTRSATVTKTLSLEPGTYSFRISDSYGDGICCAFGNGFYEVTDENGRVLAAGGAFGDSETTSFILTHGVALSHGTRSGVNEHWASVSLGSTLPSTPVVLADMQTYAGADAAGLRIRAVGDSGFEVFVEEEQSADSELAHSPETVGYLAMEEGVILDADGNFIGEVGSISQDQANPSLWHTMDDLQLSYTNPVVRMTMNTYAGTDASHMRVHNVHANGFDYQIEEWSYQDGVHTTERIAFIVIEAGTHQLATGETLQAQLVSADHHFTRVQFPQSYSAPPVVLSQSQTAYGPDDIVTRQHLLDASGVSVRVQEMESFDDVHIAETVGVISIGQ